MLVMKSYELATAFSSVNEDELYVINGESGTGISYVIPQTISIPFNDFKIMIKKFFIFSIFLLIFSAGYSKEFRFPFVCENDGTITLQISDDTFSYRFMLDTATTNNVLLKNGYSKISQKLGVDLEQSLVEFLRSNYPELAESEIKEQANNYIRSGGLQFTLTDLDCSGYKIEKSNFIYVPSEYSKIDNDTIDGIINLDTFGAIDNLLIDYGKKLIIINCDTVLKNSVKLNKFKTLNLYYITIELNGISQQGLIDTGASCLFLRSDYKENSMVDENDLLNVINNPRAKKIDEKKISMELKIGSYKSRIEGIVPNIDNYNLTDSASNILEKINLLGYSTFNDKKIQFDFKKSEFRIE